MISFRLRAKWQNCRGYVPRYERTPKNGWFDIHSVFATHTECACQLVRKATDDVALENDVKEEVLEAERGKRKVNYREEEIPDCGCIYG